MVGRSGNCSKLSATTASAIASVRISAALGAGGADGPCGEWHAATRTRQASRGEPTSPAATRLDRVQSAAGVRAGPLQRGDEESLPSPGTPLRPDAFVA